MKNGTLKFENVGFFNDFVIVGIFKRILERRRSTVYEITCVNLSEWKFRWLLTHIRKVFFIFFSKQTDMACVDNLLTHDACFSRILGCLGVIWIQGDIYFQFPYLDQEFSDFSWYLVQANGIWTWRNTFYFTIYNHMGKGVCKISPWRKFSKQKCLKA